MLYCSRSKVVNFNSADMCKYIINKQGAVCNMYYFRLYLKDHSKTFIRFHNSFMSKNVPD